MKRVNLRKIHVLFALLMLPALLLGQTVTRTYDLDGFSGINASAVVKVEYTQGDAWSVEIESEESTFGNIEARVKNGVLELSLKGNTRNPRVIARVVSPELTSIKASGAATFTSLNQINTPSLDVNFSGATSGTLIVNTDDLGSNVSGASNLTLSGRATNHRLTVSGAAQARAGELETQTTIARVSGASQARVWADELLDANASGSSRISFDNEPAATRIRTSGMGWVNGSQAHMVTESASGDTTRIRVGSRDLIIIEDQDADKVRVERRRRKSFQNNWSGFELGINGYLSPDNSFTLQPEAEPIDLRYNKSVVVNLNLWQQSFPLVSNQLGLVTGLGIGWNNYRFDNQTRLIHNSQGVQFEEEERNMRKNKLTLTWINVPLMLELQNSGRRNSQNFHIAGGMILGARIGTHAKYVYDSNGKKRKEKDYNDFNVQPFRFDATARIGWSHINLFATYSLNSLFRENKGPELYPFSVGIRVVNW